MAFELLVQMSDYLSPLWNTSLTNEVQLKLFLENYLCGSECAPVFTFPDLALQYLRTLSSGASTFVQRLHELRGVPWPSLAVWADEQREHFVFFTIIALNWNQQQPACFGWFSLCVTVLCLKTKPCPHSHRVAQKLGRETRCVALPQQHRNRPSWSRFCLQDWFPPLNGPFFCHLLSFANMPALFAAACWFNACSCLPSFATQCDELF